MVILDCNPGSEKIQIETFQESLGLFPGHSKVVNYTGILWSLHVHALSLQVCTHVYTHTHAHTFTHLCTYNSAHIPMHTDDYPYISLNTYLPSQMYKYEHTCISVYSVVSC